MDLGPAISALILIQVVAREGRNTLVVISNTSLLVRSQSQMRGGKNQKFLISGAGLGSQGGSMGLTLPPILDTKETSHSVGLSSSSLHELAIFEPNLLCNEFHVMSFKNNSKTCDFPKRRSKMFTGGSCYYRCILGLCLRDRRR